MLTWNLVQKLLIPSPTMLCQSGWKMGVFSWKRTTQKKTKTNAQKLDFFSWHTSRRTFGFKLSLWKAKEASIKLQNETFLFENVAVIPPRGRSPSPRFLNLWSTVLFCRSLDNWDTKKKAFSLSWPPKSLCFHWEIWGWPCWWSLKTGDL